jgi:hypothetical protein
MQAIPANPKSIQASTSRPANGNNNDRADLAIKSKIVYGRDDSSNNGTNPKQ